MPVILGIEPAGGHEVVTDGYGYRGGTLFHHINMGWAGDDDVWYALPNIDTYDKSGDFTMVEDCIYNIYTNGTGPIISGRITDPTGAPVPGASVTATNSSGGIFPAMTDSNGIYAILHLPADTEFTLTVTNLGYISATGYYATSKTTNSTTNTGNFWGADFTLSPPLLTIPESGFAAVGPAAGPFNETAQTYTLTNCAAAAINWTASEAPQWLTVTPSNGTVLAGGASSFSISLSSTAGTLPAGSNSATIWITNLGTGTVQSLQFSLAVESADYPIPLSGFNDDVVVENNALSDDTLLYADTFDTNNAHFSPTRSFAFYEHGLVALNYASNSVAAIAGLPVGGYFTSAWDGVTTFQFGPYTGYNVLALWPANPAGTLTLPAPLPYKTLTILSATAEGGGNGSMIVNFADGTSSSALTFNATNYFTTNSASSGAALTRFGLLWTGDNTAGGIETEFYTVDRSTLFPSLYQTSINLESLDLHTKPIASITFTMPSGLGANAVTGIFAVSGTQSPYPIITAQPEGVSIGEGASTVLSVGVSGSAPLAYQWLRNGAALENQQESTLVISNAAASNAGNYQVVVTNSSGVVTSTVATVSITNLPVAFVLSGHGAQYSNGQMILQLTNLAGQGPIIISISTNLMQWTPIFTNPSGFGSFTFTDSVANIPHRYYRATTP